MYQANKTIVAPTMDSSTAKSSDIAPQRHCHLCAQANGKEQDGLIFQHFGGSLASRSILFESANFIVFPSIGALVPGHVILCPKDHYLSIARAVVDHEEEYLDLKAGVVRALTDTFGSRVHIFEHGSANEFETPICSVTHAHLHMLPSDVQVDEHLNRRHRWKTLNEAEAESTIKSLSREYIYYERSDGPATFTLAEDGNFRSQFMRQVFARELGRANEWNWRVNTQPQNFRQTVQILGKPDTK